MTLFTVDEACTMRRCPDPNAYTAMVVLRFDPERMQQARRWLYDEGADFALLKVQTDFFAYSLHKGWYDDMLVRVDLFFRCPRLATLFKLTWA